MIRLVGKFRKELLQETHLHLAQQFAKEGKLADAEQHYVEANCWNMASELYMSSNMWEEALRVAKSYGGPKEIAEIARKWASTVGGEGGSKLLIKQGLVEAALEYECDNQNFEEAFRLAETACRHRLPDVHLRYALFLEDEKRYKEAEEEFIRAGKPGEAINMHYHNQDFHSAIRVAKQFDKPSVVTILVDQAKFYMQRRDW
jgi:intraflagellar transport protein 172